MTAPRITPTIVGSTPFAAVYNEFSATVVRQSAVDPVITELVRLRCAQYHDCRLCGSLREVDAHQAGLREDVVAQLARYESAGLSDKQLAALRLADAMIIAPANIDADLRESVRQHLTDEQIAELLFDILKWSYQKTLVALRVEPPAAADESSDLVWRADGHPTIMTRTPGGDSDAVSIGIV